MKGKHVRQLINKNMVLAFLKLTGMDDSYNAVTSGVYLYRIRTADGEMTKKMILLR